jgi:hypothetical protein
VTYNTLGFKEKGNVSGKALACEGPHL